MTYASGNMTLRGFSSSGNHHFKYFIILGEHEQFFLTFGKARDEGNMSEINFAVVKLE